MRADFCGLDLQVSSNSQVQLEEGEETTKGERRGEGVGTAVW